MRYEWVFLKALLIISLGLGAIPLKAAEPAQRRFLEIELEAIPDSLGYEVEVVRLLPDGKHGLVEKFTLKTTIWKATLSPGHYSMRVRSLDSRGVPGDWNSPKDFMVKLFSPKLLSPADQGIINSEDSKEEKVKFEWEPGEKAQSYKIEVKDQKDKVVFQNELKETSISTPLPVGTDYSWQVTPINKDIETVGESSQPLHFKVVGKKLDSPDILKITDVETKILSWKPVTYAEKYEVQLELKTEDTFRTTKSWSISQSAIKFEKPLVSGTYRLRVRATAYDRKDSDETLKEFETVNSLGEDIQRASFQLKKRFFVRFGLAPGFFNYTNNNLDLDTNSNVSAYGLSALVAGGVWLGSRSLWGIILNLEGQSIPISGKATTYGSQSFLGVKKFNFGESSQIRLHLGVQHTEVPDVASDVYGNIQQNKVSIWGPMIKIAYYRSLSPRVGLNLSGQLSPSLGGSSPARGSILTQPSEQFGFGFSKRLRENLMANLDYYYRIENAAYNHYSDFGFPNISFGTNQVTLASHNIMFSLELGF